MTGLENVVNTEKHNIIVISGTWLTSEMCYSKTQMLAFLLGGDDRQDRAGSRTVLYTTRALTIRAIKTVSRDSRTWKVVLCRLKCKCQDS